MLKNILRGKAEVRNQVLTHHIKNELVVDIMK